MQKFIARLLIPLLSVWFVLQPGIATAGAISTYRVGSTFYPLTASGALGAAVDVAMLAGRVTPWIGGLTLAYQIGKFVVEGLDSSGAVVPLNVLPAGLAQSPASVASWSGWTYDTATKTWLPPSSVVSVVEYYPQGLSSIFHPTPQAACDYYRELVVLPPITVSDLGIYSGTMHYFSCGSKYILPQGSCPSGYSGSGTCVLANASLVKYPSDNAPSVIAKADGTGFALDSRDPDNALAPGTLPAIFESSGVVDGKNTRITVEPQTGGGLKVTTEQEILNSDGSISTYRQSVLTSAAGEVQSTTGANYPGGLAEQTSQSTALAPTATSGEFPTDYNRETTQLAIRDELQAVGEVATYDPALDTSTATLKAHYDNNLDAAKITDAMNGVGLPALPSFLFFPTFTAPACHAIGWTFQAREVSFDICPHVPTIKSIAAWILNLLAAGICFQMIMNFRAMRVRG